MHAAKTACSTCGEPAAGTVSRRHERARGACRTRLHVLARATERLRVRVPTHDAVRSSAAQPAARKGSCTRAAMPQRRLVVRRAALLVTPGQHAPTRGTAGTAQGVPHAAGCGGAAVAGRPSSLRRRPRLSSSMRSERRSRPRLCRLLTWQGTARRPSGRPWSPMTTGCCCLTSARRLQRRARLTTLRRHRFPPLRLRRHPRRRARRLRPLPTRMRLLSRPARRVRFRVGRRRQRLSLALTRRFSSPAL